MGDDTKEEIRRRSVDYIKRNWGNLDDLPQHVIPVVWVTTYRSVEVAMKAAAKGGRRLSLVGDDLQLTNQLEIAITKIRFLRRMIALLRSSSSQRQQRINGYVLVDALKWALDRNIDLKNVSGLRRMMMRYFAKTDPEYKSSIPPELLQ